MESQELVQEGYEAGLVDGEVKGRVDGKTLGYSKGFELGEEIGCYHQTLTQLPSNDKITQLLTLIKDFPRENRPDASMIDCIRRIRANFKLILAQSGLKAEPEKGISW